jgi:hypothetical protein
MGMEAGPHEQADQRHRQQAQQWGTGHQASI